MREEDEKKKINWRRRRGQIGTHETVLEVNATHGFVWCAIKPLRHGT